MTCMKCNGSMKSYERNGITIDQCSECRGVFLDRGELDRLIDAESQAFPAPAPQQPEYANNQRERSYNDYGYRDDGYSNHGYKKKKRGFLSEIFDD